MRVRRQNNPDTFLRSMFLVPPPPSSADHLRYSSYQHGSADRSVLSPVGKTQRPPTDNETSSSSASKPTTTSPSRQRRGGSYIKSVENTSISGIRPESGPGFPFDVFPGHTRTSNSNISQYDYDESSRSSRFIVSTRVVSSSRHSATRNSPPKLPHALVLTRLERAGNSTHSALAEVLRTRVVPIGSNESGNASSSRSCGSHDDEWNLPSGFFVVYVCGIGNGKERPIMPSFMVCTLCVHTTGVVLTKP